MCMIGNYRYTTTFKRPRVGYRAFRYTWIDGKMFLRPQYRCSPRVYRGRSFTSSGPVSADNMRGFWSYDKPPLRPAPCGAVVLRVLVWGKTAVHRLGRRSSRMRLDAVLNVGYRAAEAAQAYRLPMVAAQ